MPCDYRKYPLNWKTHIVPTIRQRSDDHCEWCGVRNHAFGFRASDGSFYEEDGERFIPDEALDNKPITIVLTVAHLDHDKANNDGMDAGGPALPLDRANLVHLCQRCHLNHDRERHTLNRARNRDLAAGQTRMSFIEEPEHENEIGSKIPTDESLKS